MQIARHTLKRGSYTQQLHNTPPNEKFQKNTRSDIKVQKILLLKVLKVLKELKELKVSKVLKVLKELKVELAKPSIDTKNVSILPRNLII